MRYIEHVTLTTGDSRRSERGEVAGIRLDGARALIARLGETPDSTVPIAEQPGYSVGGRGQGRCLVATVWADGPTSEIIASIGIAAHNRCGAVVWRALHQYGRLPVVTDPDSQPQPPWCAAALEIGILRHMDASEWLGDFERCLAWAWIRTLEERR